MKTRFALPALALLFGAAAPALADEAHRSDVLERHAVVQTVDMEARQVLIKTDDGDMVVINAGPEVRNLAQVQPGDDVNLAYYQAVSLRNAPADAVPTTASVTAAARAAEGDKPGAAAGKVTVMIVDFIDYDPATYVARFVDGSGLVRFATVRPEMREFAAARKDGDRVEITIEEAVAIAIEPAAK